MSEDLKYRMSQLEVSPPGEAWNNISYALDEIKELQPLSERLRQTDITPPPTSWQQIAERLEIPVVEISKPERKIGFTIYRVAASVVIVTLLISSAWKLFQPASVDGRGNQEKELQNAAVNNSSLLPSFPIDIQKSTRQEKINSDAKDNITIRVIRTGNDDLEYKRAVNYASIEGSRWLTKETPIVIDAKPIEPEEMETKRIFISNLQSNSYLFVMGAEGQKIRVSTKFADFIHFLTADLDANSSGEITNAETIRWKNLIKEWREKIIRSGYIPTSGNFLDIVEFKEFLRKNQ